MTYRPICTCPKCSATGRRSEQEQHHEDDSSGVRCGEVSAGGTPVGIDRVTIGAQPPVWLLAVRTVGARFDRGIGAAISPIATVSPRGSAEE